MVLLLLACSRTFVTGGRLAYNRIDKAASTSMLFLLNELGKEEHFEVHNNGQPYFPSPPVLRQQLDTVPDGAVWINHANFLESATDDFVWMNVVRDPLERQVSVRPAHVAHLASARVMNGLSLHACTLSTALLLYRGPGGEGSP